MKWIQVQICVSLEFLGNIDERSEAQLFLLGLGKQAHRSE